MFHCYISFFGGILHHLGNVLQISTFSNNLVQEHVCFSKKNVDFPSMSEFAPKKNGNHSKPPPGLDVPLEFRINGLDQWVITPTYKLDILLVGG